MSIDGVIVGAHRSIYICGALGGGGESSDEAAGIEQQLVCPDQHARRPTLVIPDFDIFLNMVSICLCCASSIFTCWWAGCKGPCVRSAFIFCGRLFGLNATTSAQRTDTSPHPATPQINQPNNGDNKPHDPPTSSGCAPDPRATRMMRDSDLSLSDIISTFPSSSSSVMESMM